MIEILLSMRVEFLLIALARSENLEQFIFFHSIFSMINFFWLNVIHLISCA